MHENRLDGFDSSTFKKFLEKYTEMITNCSTHTVCMSSLLCAMLTDSQPYNEMFITVHNRELNESMDTLWEDMAQLAIKNSDDNTKKTTISTTEIEKGQRFENESIKSEDSISIKKSIRPDLVASELKNYEITSKMICNFLNSVSNDIETASEELNYFIEEKLIALSNYCNLDTYNEPLRKKAYKDVVCGIFEFIKAKYIYFQSIADAYRPLSIYSNEHCLLKDNCRLSNYLKDSSHRWITLSNLTNSIRPPSIVMDSIHLKYLDLVDSFKVMLNKNIKNDILLNYENLLKLYCEAVNSCTLSNVDVPSCFHIFPSLTDNLLQNCCDYDMRSIAKNLLDMENHKQLNSVIYSEAGFYPWSINGHIIPGEIDCKKMTKNVILKLDTIYNMIASETNVSADNVFLDEQNIVVKQLAALLCPSISYYASKIALLLLYGNNSIVECLNVCCYSVENAIISSLPSGTTVQSYNGEFDNHLPSIAIVLNTIDLQVPLIWNIIPKRTITQHFDSSHFENQPPLMTIKTIFRLSMEISDLFKTRFYLFTKVNVKILYIKKEQFRQSINIIRKMGKFLKG